jgi:hypothetical protein
VPEPTPRSRPGCRDRAGHGTTTEHAVTVMASVKRRDRQCDLSRFRQQPIRVRSDALQYRFSSCGVCPPWHSR